MIPPIPHGLVPVTTQHDPPTVRPDIAPVMPVDPSAGNSGPTLERRPADTLPEESYTYDGQGRQHARDGDAQAEEEQASAEAALIEETIAGLEEAPRLGQVIDVEV
ncbi:MAG: hypothetical protein GAK45_01331 [Pseudomonas citronellolis]|nr:MAG: hypothetical protein GAK45_01331 [Pseudomonas citronellolis]